MFDYDLLIIGAGAAGSSAADEAAGRGARVALVERHRMGGTCLNYGCDPTKAMLYIAEQLHSARTSAGYGIDIRSARLNWGQMRSYVDGVINTIRGGSDADARAAVERSGVAVLGGTAVFRDPHTVLVDGRPVRAERVLIAAGSHVSVPHIPGLAELGYITNREAVSLPELPRRLAIIGGGPEGVEFAQIFSRFGARVTLIDHEPHLLGHMDADLAKILTELLEREGIRVETSTGLEAVERAPGGKRLQLRSVGAKRAHTLVVDEILVATGFKPDLSALHLEAAGVEIDERGAIGVDATLRTSVPHIWAAGDIASRFLLTNVAAQQGRLAAVNALGDTSEPFDDRVVPGCVYTRPMLAMVGALEGKLRADGVDVRCATVAMAEVERAVVEGHSEGAVKLLVDGKGRILGAHALAYSADNLIASFAVAMRAGMTVAALADTLMPYPTAASAVQRVARRILEQDR
jgi:pyruvate/2-oxoglutarate dehydrogenase complex dihydrolipoamide dehydrogenase (E3) component